jgi:hypothetical protein
MCCLFWLWPPLLDEKWLLAANEAEDVEAATVGEIRLLNQL